MLRIRRLGRFEATLDGEPLPGLGPQLSRLFARLALDADSPLEQKRLRDELWPQSETLQVVQKSLQRLQIALGTQRWRLKAERGNATFQIRKADVDVLQFLQYIDQGTKSALEKAVELYRGDLLEDWEQSDPLYGPLTRPTVASLATIATMSSASYAPGTMNARLLPKAPGSASRWSSPTPPKPTSLSAI